MTDTNEMCESVMVELNTLVITDTDESKEQQESSSCHDEAASEDIPPVLLSYFKTSKSRAAVCEKLILEDLEDFTASHHTKGGMNLPIELNKDMMKLNEQGICEAENEENKADNLLLHEPTETQALFTHDVPASSNNEAEAGTHEYLENENYLTLKFSEYEAEREKHHCEEMQKKEQRQQREIDFQEELRKIMEAEKLQQMELELMERRAQEKLEQELLLQQELISNLQKRVEQERRMIEEEQRRKKEEEEERKEKEKEEKRKMEEEEERRKREEDKRKRKEEEERRKREEEDKRKRKEEEKRRKRKEGEERGKREEEDKRKRQEERTRMEEEENKKKVEMRLKEEEERRKKEEEEQRTKKEEEKRRKSEEEKNKIEEEKRKMDEQRKIEEIRSKEEEKRRQAEEEERKTIVKEEKQKEREEKREVEETRKREEERKMIEMEEKKRKNEEAIKPEDELRKKEEERKRGDEEEVRLTKEPEVRKKQEDIRKRKVERKSEEERGKSAVEKKTMDEERGEEKRKTEERRHSVENKDTTRKEEEMKTKEEEEIERWEQEEKEYRNTEEEMEGNKSCEEDNRKMDHERKTKDEERRQEEVKKHHEKDGMGKKEDIHADKRHVGEKVRETKEENIKTEDRRLEEEKGGIKRKQDTSCSLPASLPECTEQKRLSWMKDCIPWSKLSLQNRRKQKGSLRGRRAPRRPAEGGGLPPLCPEILLQSTGWRSLQEVTTVTMEDLPGCSLSSLLQCTQLQSLTLRRCGVKSLEGIRQLQELCYIDLQENDISFVDCENMSCLRVLRLAHNKLTSIHGLSGADNLDVLDLSHNSITRIAGLESLRRLQRLSLNHNQLISTKGLRDVYTLLHLDCSHNHLASVEGLENSALLHTLDLRANSLTEPPSLNNQVLLRELLLDDNSISSLQGLTACWLPLMQHLSSAQNRITQLPSMSDFVSLEYLDLRFNCLSELQDVCENLERCQFLQEVHLTGNPLQQESGWRSTLQKAVPGLRAIDSQEIDSFLSPPAVQHVSMASGCFVTFCQAQLRQTRDLQQRHGRELSDASSPLDAVKSSCRHFTVTLKLAEDQRFAHEYGDTTLSDELWAVGQTTTEKTLDVDSIIAEKLTDCPKMESISKLPPVTTSRDNIECNYWSFEETPTAESRCDTIDSVNTVGQPTGPTVSKANSGSVHFFTAKGKTTAFNIEKPPVSSHRELDLKNTAAVVIQQQWRKYRQRCVNINAPTIAEKRGERGGAGGKPESGPSYIKRSAVDQDYAATAIQAFWRGFTLRRRLASALAAVTCPNAVEDDTFEEVDMDEFVFDEATLERHCKMMLSEDSPPRHYPVSEQPLSLKPPGPCLDPSQYILPPPLVWSPKQAWVSGEHIDSAAQRISTESSNRSKSLSSSSVLSGLSERSEKILEEWGFADSHTALLMLRRAQKMKSKKQQQKKHLDPSVRLALFRNCSYQLGPVEARNRPARHTRNYVKVGEAELGLQQAEKMEQVEQEQAQQWLQTQAAQTDRHSESEHFLPEINSSILNGGRVQLVADPAYADRLHHASGLWANSSLAAQPCKVSSYPRRNSWGHARKEDPSPKQVTSAPSKKERISFRDNPVQLSGGWGGGKKRDRVHK